jgi:hypothetical protein
MIVDELSVIGLSTNIEMPGEPVVGSILEAAMEFKPDLIVNG